MLQTDTTTTNPPACPPRCAVAHVVRGLLVWQCFQNVGFSVKANKLQEFSNSFFSRLLSLSLRQSRATGGGRTPAFLPGCALAAFCSQYPPGFNPPPILWFFLLINRTPPPTDPRFCVEQNTHTQPKALGCLSSKVFFIWFSLDYPKGLSIIR